VTRSERLAILLPAKPDEASGALAASLAEELGAAVLARGRRTVRDTLSEGYDGVISLTRDGPRYHTSCLERPFFHHPGLARNRVLGLIRGGPDTLVRAACLEPGVSVLDATLGKAADATVAAWTVGESGRVVGVESHPVMAALVRIGLRRTGTEWPELEEAMRRIEVLTGDHLAVLRAQRDASFDVVCFDPLFADPVLGSTDMDSLRELGARGPVSEEALAEARRVARLRVVHKVRADRPAPTPLAGWRLVRGKRVVGYRVWDTEHA
jgi:16S rRNA (guanine1516-N2)-methyltransferase